jgi:hypothetical protein
VTNRRRCAQARIVDEGGGGVASGNRSSSRRAQRRSAGQGLVEFALVAPVLFLLLLIAVDFGRLFVGWITLNNMARVGANFAAEHPNAWPGSPTDPLQVLYRQQMTANMDTTDCPPVPTPLPDPSFGPTRNPGDTVRVDLSCQFRPLTPLVTAIVGQVVTVTTHSAFAIASGCIAACPTFGPGPTPSTTPVDNCRTVPNLVNLSVAGARLAWTNAGFLATTFSPATGLDTQTVASQTVTEPADATPCDAGEAFFSSTVAVTVAPLPSPPAGSTCLVVPNLLGMLVGDARAAWTAASFTGAFTPTGQDSMIVNGQVTTPASQPGDCLDATASVAVSYGAAPPPPPAAPCKVPSFVNTSSNDALASWTSAGFAAGKLSFATNPGHPLPYTVKSQTLVGGTYVGCSSAITLSWQ